MECWPSQQLITSLAADKLKGMDTHVWHIYLAAAVIKPHADILLVSFMLLLIVETLDDALQFCGGVIGH